MQRIVSKNQAGRSLRQAFSLIELLVVIVAVTILGCLLGASGGSDSKASACAANLRQIGVGVAMYAQQNGGKLPYGFIQYSDIKHSTWDGLIIPFVKAASNNATGVRGERLSTNSKLFQCPEDNAAPISWAKGKSRRTYSMSKHNMKSANWPPSSNNATGLGLWWGAPLGYAPDSPLATLETMRSYVGEFPAVTLNMITEPKNTLLLTEFPRPKNIMGNSSGAVVIRSEMVITNGGSGWSSHGKKFNYLMVDGHVDLRPVETSPIALTNRSGIWTIRAGD